MFGHPGYSTTPRNRSFARRYGLVRPGPLSILTITLLPSTSFVPWRALNGRHKSTMMCKSGAERKRWRLAEAEIRESTEMAFEVYRKHIKLVPRFTYLGRVMTAGDDDWPAVAGNLAKVRKSWGRLQGILRREGATPRISGKFSRRLYSNCCCLGRRRGW